MNNTNNDNLARHLASNPIAINHDISKVKTVEPDGRKWELIDLAEHDLEVAIRVRQEELEKFCERRKRERRVEKMSRQRSFVSTMPKIVGTVLVLAALLSIIVSSQIGTIMCFMIGTLLLIPVNRR